MQPTAVEEGTQEGTEVSDLHQGTSVMAEAHGLVWRRRASHLLSHCLSTPPRASPGQGSLDQGLVRQMQQLGDTVVVMPIREGIFLSWTLLLVNLAQHKQVCALHGHARGSGSLYQNIPQWEGKDFFNHRQGHRTEGQNKRAKDLEGITSDTSKNSWDLQSRGETEWEAQEME